MSFDHETVFGGGDEVKFAVRSGASGALWYYGDSTKNQLLIVEALHAIRRDFLQYGNGTGAKNQDQITSDIGIALINGVHHVLARFGDRPKNRHRIIEAFIEYERMLVALGTDLPLTEDYDREDDQNGQGFGGSHTKLDFKTGNSRGCLVIGGPVAGFGQGSLTQ